MVRPRLSLRPGLLMSGADAYGLAERVLAVVASHPRAEARKILVDWLAFGYELPERMIQPAHSSPPASPPAADQGSRVGADTLDHSDAADSR